MALRTRTIPTGYVCMAYKSRVIPIRTNCTEKLTDAVATEHITWRACLAHHLAHFQNDEVAMCHSLDGGMFIFHIIQYGGEAM